MTDARGRGFTLVEAVVTIGVIAALMAILVPGIRTVIEASRSRRNINTSQGRNDIAEQIEIGVTNLT